MREMADEDGYWAGEGTDSEGEGDQAFRIFDDGEQDFWGESPPRAPTQMEDVDVVETTTNEKGVVEKKQLAYEDYTAIMQLIMTLHQMNLLGHPKNEGNDQGSEPEKQEHCYPTTATMVSEPSPGTPL